MGIRFDNRKIVDNEEEIYGNLLEKRGVNKIRQYTTPTMSSVSYSARTAVPRTYYTWSVGDTYWKLADSFYNDSSLWWLIAWFNQKPTEAHLSEGDTIAIPIPLSRALELYYRQD